MKISVVFLVVLLIGISEIGVECKRKKRSRVTPAHFENKLKIKEDDRKEESSGKLSSISNQHSF